MAQVTANVMAYEGTAFTSVAVPDLSSSPTALAAWWRSTGRDLQRLVGAIRTKLQDEMIQRGDLPGLGLTRTYEWDPSTGSEFPDLVINRTVSAEVVDEDEYQRLVELILEQVPNAKYTFTSKVDGRKANQVLLRGGDDGRRLQELRTAKDRLVIK